jgi:hypothetical protein
MFAISKAADLPGPLLLNFVKAAQASFYLAGVQVKQGTYFPLVSATEMDSWQAILT